MIILKGSIFIIFESPGWNLSGSYDITTESQSQFEFLTSTTEVSLYSPEADKTHCTFSKDAIIFQKYFLFLLQTTTTFLSALEFVYLQCGSLEIR